MIFFGGAVHAFTNPAADSDKTRGAAYDEKAARRSWQHMKMFFKEIFYNALGAGEKEGILVSKRE